MSIEDLPDSTPPDVVESVTAALSAAEQHQQEIAVLRARKRRGGSAWWTRLDDTIGVELELSLEVRGGRR